MRPGGWRGLVPSAVLTGGLLIGGAAADTASPTPSGPNAPGRTATATHDAAPSPPGMATPVVGVAARPQPPVALHIPAIGVDHGLVPLAADAVGVLVPPDSPEVPGWFTGSAVPGEIGPAVIAGHVDSRTGPGVFYRLRELRPGDEVLVDRPDGVAVFRVRSVQVVAKAEFPTGAVYGPVPVPELRLITCGGLFARATGHYTANVIARAELVRGP